MSGVATAIVGGAAIGGYMNQQATEGAAATQAQAAADSNQLQWQMYQQQRADMEPYRQAGTGALSDLTDPTLGVDLTQDPGYQFRLNQGVKALDASASARGNLMSGAQQKAIVGYGQNLASQEYQNAYNRQFNRLSQLAGIGSGTEAQLVQASGQYGQNVANNQMNAANASAAAQMAGAQNFSNMLGQGAMAYGMYNQGAGA